MTHATDMVAKLEAIMLANPGASSVSVDGTTITMRDLTTEWEKWKAIAARESGTRPRMVRMRMNGFNC